MNFVALISGGKDGIYAAAKCITAGHSLVAVLNLRPPNDGEEPNSYMFQAVGCEVVKDIAYCLNKPLLQGILRGSSKNTNLLYEPTAEDEVEDLYNLIFQALQAYPYIHAVSSGAIESRYQKFRIENICHRLGLISLTPLWGLDPEHLLHEMINWDLKAIIVRVCSEGLDQSYLGKELSEILPQLLFLHSRKGLHICGEGGEFETLVMDCPLFSQSSICIHDKCIVVEVDNGIQFRGRLNITNLTIKEKAQLL